MTSILVLLVLLSVATLASRPAALSGLLDRVAAPLLIALGISLGPAGLGTLASGLIDALKPALAVGVTWLGVLIGLRAGSHDFSAVPQAADAPGSAQSGSARAAIIVVLSTLASVLLAMAAMAVPQHLGLRDGDHMPLLAGAALILGGALIGSPPVNEESRAELAMRGHLVDAGDLIAGACAVVALAVLPTWSTLSPVASAIVVVGSGIIMALVQRLLGGSASGDAATRTIALLGVVAVVAGILHDAQLPSAVAGIVAGVVLGKTELGQRLREALSPTERPARIVVVFLIGAVVPLSLVALLVGALLAVTQLIVRVIATSWAVGHRPDARATAAGLSSSAVPLVISASYALAGLPEGELLLATAAAAVVITDVLAAAITTVTLVASRRPGSTPPTIVGAPT